MNEDLLVSICCSAPPVVAKTDIFTSSIPAGDIDFDTMDGNPSDPESWVSRTIAFGTCSDCQERSRLVPG